MPVAPQPSDDRQETAALLALIGSLRQLLAADLIVAFQVEADGLAVPVAADPAMLPPAFQLSSTRLAAVDPAAGPQDARQLRLPSGLLLLLDRPVRQALFLPAAFKGSEGSGALILWHEQQGVAPPALAAAQGLRPVLSHLLDEHRNAQARRALRERFNDLVESVPLGIVILDGEGEGAFLNREAGHLVGLPPGNATAARLGDAMRGLRLRCRNATLLDGLYEGLGASADFSLVTTWDLGDRQLEVDTHPVLADGSKGRLWLFNDITQRLAAERLKEDFVSTVSHELRTPLTAIRGALGLVVGGLAGEVPETMRDLLRIAHSNGERLILLVNDILDMEKIRAGRMEFRPERLPACSLMAQAIEANRTYAAQFDVTLRWVEGSDLEDFVLVDPVRLQQVLANLLSNAAKFSPRGGEVALALVALPDVLRFSVRDHGAGIPPEFRDRIFQRFAQAETTVRTRSGTGLGLNIAKAIVEHHGGEIGFECPADGGTLFYFTLPRATG